MAEGAEATPIIQEVEEIKLDAIDPNEALYDEQGALTEYFDREKNTRYVKKGVAAPTDDAAKAAAEAEKAAAKAAADELAKAGAAGAGAGDPPPEDVIIGNPAEYILRKRGYEKDEVNLGGEGDQANLVKLADLTPEQQIDIVIAEFDTAAAEYEAKIKELEAKAPELKFENPLHQKIVDYLKDGGDVAKLAKELLSKDPATQAKMLSDADVVKLGIKKEFPEYSDEEVEEEFKDLEKANAVGRRAKALRARMEKEQPNIDNLTEEQKAAKQAEFTQLKTEYESEVKSVKDFLSKAKAIAGIPVNEEMKKFLESRVIPSNMDSESEFQKGLNSPEKLVRMEFLDRYFESIQQKTADFYYQKGIKYAQSLKASDLEKLSDEPHRVYSLSGAGKAGASKKPKTVDDIEDWAKFAESATF